MALEAKGVKVVIVGDPYSGKTAIAETYINNKYPFFLYPTVFEDYKTNFVLDETPCVLNVHDTSGFDDYRRLRPLIYPKADCFLICFSVVSRLNYDNVVKYWVPEIRHHMPNAPTILIGTKIDLRDDPNSSDVISKEEGIQLGKYINAFKYVECSAKNNIGLDFIFEEVVQCVLLKNNNIVKKTKNKNIRKMFSMKK